MFGPRLALIVLLLGASASAFAATEPSAPGASPAEARRFLFVVDVSQRMKGMEHGGRQAVFDLLYSGLGDTLKPGDTIGVWPFHQSVNAGQFPLQTWNPQKRLEIASEAGRFLQQQSYAGEPNVNRAISDALALSADVGEILVILVTSGATRPAELPISQSLRETWDGKALEAVAANKTVVAGFALREGRVAGAEVIREGQPLNMAGLVAKLVPEPKPVTPSNPPPVAAAQPAPEQPPQAAPPPNRPRPAPIIMIGKPQQSNVVAAAVPEPEKPAPAKTEPVVAVTNQPPAQTNSPALAATETKLLKQEQPAKEKAAGPERAAVKAPLKPATPKSDSPKSVNPQPAKAAIPEQTSGIFLWVILCLAVAGGIASVLWWRRRQQIQTSLISQTLSRTGSIRTPPAP